MNENCRKADATFQSANSRQTMKYPLAKLALPLLLMTTLLTSCTAMTKRECLGGEWHSAGEEDATRGRTKDRYTAHAGACSKHGIVADKSLYDSGYEQGLQSYCSHDNGLQTGRETGNYRGICPVASEKDFLYGYLEGLNLALDKLNYRYDKAQSDLSEAQYRHTRAETDTDRAKLDRFIQKKLTSIRWLNDERRKVRSTISRWRHQI